MVGRTEVEANEGVLLYVISDTGKLDFDWYLNLVQDFLASNSRQLQYLRSLQRAAWPNLQSIISEVNRVVQAPTQ